MSDETALHNRDVRQHLEALIEIHRKNIQHLELQAARYGALEVPLHIQNSLDEESEQIAQIEAQLHEQAAPPLPTPAGDLPVPATTLIGREREVAEAVALLRRADVRLLTLSGPGGTGKTHLSIQIAAELRDEFIDGAWFVELASISDPDLVLPTIAQTLGVIESGERPLSTRLKEYLRERKLLLVLDNFEQVTDAASFVAGLVAAAPHVKTLVTSRELLRISAEREFAVPPLALPDLLQFPPIGANVVSPALVDDELLPALAQSAAVALFVQRAQAARPGFALTSSNARAVAEICVRLDGLPLAIELAAARSKLLTPADLLKRLDNRLKLLIGGMRDLPPRQQTLRGTIDWSYDLLGDGERALFARLTVFIGGSTIETAETVCGGVAEQIAIGGAPAAEQLAPLDLDVLDGLTSLVEKSLLRQIDAANGEPRFAMLETIREYALEKLAESGEADALRRRHAAHFLALAEQAAPELTGAEQEIWLERLRAEHDNLRAALGWALGRQEAETALRMGGALWRFWYTRGHLTEGRKWLEQALADGGEVAASVRAQALVGAGGLAHAQCDYARASVLYEEGLALRRDLGDQRGIATSLNNLGLVMRDQGDYGAARDRLEEALAAWRETGDAWGIAGTLNNWGQVADDQGDYVRATALIEESLSLYRELGDTWGIAQSLNNLGLAALHQGDQARARTFLIESLTLSRKLGDSWNVAYALTNLGHVAISQGDYDRAITSYVESLGLLKELGDNRIIAECLEGLAGAAAAQGGLERAARLWGTAEALREAVSAPLLPADRPRYELMVAHTRAQLDEAAWVAAWAAGRALALEQALAAAQGGA